MKKHIAILLASIFIISVTAACGETPAPSVSSNTSVEVTPSVSVSVEPPVVETPDPGDVDEWTNERPSDIAADETAAAKMAAAFLESAGEADVMAVAHKITDIYGISSDVDVVEVSEGYLNGFSADITGFKSGAAIAPFIGSIPFISYVFETDDAASLVALIESNADLRWNICTMADEIKIEQSGNYVFVVMAPWEF